MKSNQILEIKNFILDIMAVCIGLMFVGPIANDMFSGEIVKISFRAVCGAMMLSLAMYVGVSMGTRLALEIIGVWIAEAFPAMSLFVFMGGLLLLLFGILLLFLYLSICILPKDVDYLLVVCFMIAYIIHLGAMSA